MGDNKGINDCCCRPCVARESFIGKEVIWTGWHKRPPPRDIYETRDKCALRCAVDPEKKTESPPPKSNTFGLEGTGPCQEPPYPEDYDPSLASIKEKLNAGKEDITDMEQRFANMAPGTIGRRRESMLDNYLLYRPQTGKQIRCCTKLPCEDFVYGAAIQGGWKAADALRGWAGTGLKKPKQQMVKKLPKDLCCTDILALNRAAVMAGVVTASEFRNYRNTHCLSFSKLAAKGGERLPPIKADKNAIYGMKSNFVTNMKELMSDQELHNWQNCVRNCLRERVIVKKQNKPDPWKENTAYLLRASHSVCVPQEERFWHLPKFEKKAKPHLCTFRSDAAFEAAAKNDMFESVGREGMHGHGIVTKAVNKAEMIYPYKN